VLLKSGKKFEGKIIDKTDEFIKLERNGIILTYYYDEIEKIEEATMTADVQDLKSQARPLQPAPLETRPYGEATAPQPSFSLGSKSEVDDASGMSKSELTLRLITASGARDQMNQMFANMLAEAPPEEAEKIRAIFNVDELIMELIPIYDKYFQKKELFDLLSFYQSEVGQKLLKVTPLIMQEGAQASIMYLQKKIQASMEP